MTGPRTATPRALRFTGASITDDQIRELRSRTGWKGRGALDQQTIAIALSTDKWLGFDAHKREEARARCAKMLNARNVKAKDR